MASSWARRSGFLNRTLQASWPCPPGLRLLRTECELDEIWGLEPGLCAQALVSGVPGASPSLPSTTSGNLITSCRVLGTLLGEMESHERSGTLYQKSLGRHYKTGWELMFVIGGSSS